MEIKNHKILLTVIDRGRLGASVSNASAKEEIRKIMTSPYETRVLTTVGKPTDKFITPKNHYKAVNDFKPREIQSCTRKNTLSETTVNYFIANEGRPYSINSKKWEKMSDKERLEVNLSLSAEGKDFTYEII